MFRYTPELVEVPGVKRSTVFIITVNSGSGFIRPNAGCTTHMNSVKWDGFSFNTTAVHLDEVTGDFLFCGSSSTPPFSHEAGILGGFMIHYDPFFIVQSKILLAGMTSPICTIFTSPNNPFVIGSS